MLFKGGTSLSKTFGLFNHFSEDIDITVFRNDLGEPASVLYRLEERGWIKGTWVEKPDVDCRWSIA